MERHLESAMSRIDVKRLLPDDYLIRLRRIIRLKPTFKKNPAAGKSAVGGLEFA